MAPKHNKGFSLVEILVVVVILVLLYWLATKFLFKSNKDIGEDLKKSVKEETGLNVETPNMPKLITDVKKSVNKSNEALKENLKDLKNQAKEVQEQQDR
jgi:prepilin-type N-terminal cleavage/methylation domain-containing protein